MRQDAEVSIDQRVFLLRRWYGPRRRQRRHLFDAVPLLDVVLILYLFLFMQSSFIVQPGIRIELPVSAFADGAAYGDLVVTLSQEGLVFFNDERPTLDGLHEEFRRAVHGKPDATLLVEADWRVSHGSLTAVYNMAWEAGIVHVVIANRLPARDKGLGP